VHGDNARPHTARLSVEFFVGNGMKTASYPPCSPNIAPSDFCLFGYGKGYLGGCSFVDAEELFEAVQRVLDNIET
jgi:hypothetical protein